MNRFVRLGDRIIVTGKFVAVTQWMKKDTSDGFTPFSTLGHGHPIPSHNSKEKIVPEEWRALQKFAVNVWDIDSCEVKTWMVSKFTMDVLDLYPEEGIVFVAGNDRPANLSENLSRLTECTPTQAAYRVHNVNLKAYTFDLKCVDWMLLGHEFEERDYVLYAKACPAVESRFKSQYDAKVLGEKCANFWDDFKSTKSRRAKNGSGQWKAMLIQEIELTWSSLKYEERKPAPNQVDILWTRLFNNLKQLKKAVL